VLDVAAARRRRSASAAGAGAAGSADTASAAEELLEDAGERIAAEFGGVKFLDSDTGPPCQVYPPGARAPRPPRKPAKGSSPGAPGRPPRPDAGTYAGMAELVVWARLVASERTS